MEAALKARQAADGLAASRQTKEEVDALGREVHLVEP